MNLDSQNGNWSFKENVSSLWLKSWVKNKVYFPFILSRRHLIPLFTFTFSR